MQTSLIEVESHKYETLTRKHWLPWFRPNFVWVHGFCAPFQDQSHLLDEIYNRGYNVYALNLPGHGASERVPAVTWEALTVVASELVNNHWKISKFTLGGYSLGAGLALKLVAAIPQRIKAIKLVTPFCHPDSILHLGTVPGIIRYKLHHSHHARAGIRPRAKDAVGADFTWNVESYAKPVITYDVNLAENHIPITALIHTDDEVLNNPVVETFFSTVPNSKVIKVPQLSHDIFYIDEFETKMIVDRLGL